MTKMYLIRMMGSRKLPLAKEADDVMETEDFREYVATHGYHFTEKLAEHTSKLMVNADGSHHTWSCNEVRSALNIPLPSWWTIGDATHAANQLYADYHHPMHALATEAEVLRLLRVKLDDKDGYDGMEFLRFVSDLIGRGENIDWARFI